MVERRLVRTTDAFENDLDRQLPEERSGTGTPSRLDFLLFEMPHIVEIFAARFETLQPLTDEPSDVRSLIGEGTFVRFYFVAGRLAADGAVELETIDIELHPPDH